MTWVGNGNKIINKKLKEENTMIHFVRHQLTRMTFSLCIAKIYIYIYIIKNQQSDGHDIKVNNFTLRLSQSKGLVNSL